MANLECRKCQSTVFKWFDADFWSCIHCGTLSERDFTPVFTQIMPKPRAWPETAVWKAEVDALWSEITLLRSERVAWKTIIETLDMDMTAPTLSRRYQKMLEEKGVEPYDGPREAFVNPGPKIKRFRGPYMILGRRSCRENSPY